MNLREMWRQWHCFPLEEMNVHRDKERGGSGDGSCADFFSLFCFSVGEMLPVRYPVRRSFFFRADRAWVEREGGASFCG